VRKVSGGARRAEEPGFESGPRFPWLRARSLNGRPYRLPEDLEGDLNLLLIGFEWWQQSLIDSWVAALERLVARRPGLRFYELVVVPHQRLPARLIIDGGMVAGIPSREVRARTLTAYTDLQAFLTTLGLGGTSDIVVLLTDRTGRIRWRSTVGHDAARQAALQRALASE